MKPDHTGFHVELAAGNHSWPATDSDSVLCEFET